MEQPQDVTNAAGGQSRSNAGLGLSVEELRAVCDLTAKLTELRQTECKHLRIENFAPDLFHGLLTRLDDINAGLQSVLYLSPKERQERQEILNAAIRGMCNAISGRPADCSGDPETVSPSRMLFLLHAPL